MNEDDSKRQAQAILYIAGVFKLALLNTAFFVSSSFLLTIIGSPFLSEIVGRGIYPELSNYCSTRECVYSASTVSAIYFFHGIYSIAFILSILYKYRRLRDREKSKDFYFDVRDVIVGGRHLRIGPAFRVREAQGLF